MKRRNNNSRRLEPRFNGLFQRLLEPFHRASDQQANYEMERENHVSPQPPETAQSRKSTTQMRRLLVAVDASQQSLMALEAAADLAASLKAELRGLFVEDIELLRIADLPVVREVLYPCGTGAHIDSDRMERQLRAQASQARQALTSICQKRHIRWSFNTVRGNVKSEILAAATEADLLILGRVSRPLMRPVHIGSTARAAIQDASSSVLLTHTSRKIRSPVVTIFHASPCGQRTLAMAIHLAQKTGGYLTILLPSEAAGEPARRSVRTQASELLRRRKLMVRYRRVADTGIATIEQAIDSEASGVVVLSECLLPPNETQTLLENLERPVLLVR